MENTLKISPALSGLPTIDYRTLNDFQGDFKTLSEVEYTKLKLNLFGDGVIPQNEFFVPLMVWIEPKSKKPYILDGHQRINVIKSLNGMPYELPYIEIAAKNKNEAKKKLALVNSQYGKITRDGWDSFMHDVDTDWVRGMTTLEAFTLPPLEGFGKDFETESSGLAPNEQDNYVNGENTDYDALYQKDMYEQPNDEDIHTDIIIGDFFQIGNHRLICGDSTNKKHLDLLMRGEKAELYITDPPYGVCYADKNKYLNTIAKGNRIQTEIIGDHLSLEQTSVLWDKSFELADANMSEKASYYIFSAQGGDLLMMMMMIDKHFQLKHCLIWVKNNHVLGRCDYSYKHEPILYGWRKKKTHNFYGGFKTSTFNYNKPIKNDLHPTMKPVELVAELIENSSVVGDIILDNFLGSGTAMVASHGLNRKCYGLELSPKYCQVIIDRMIRLDPALVITKNGKDYYGN